MKVDQESLFSLPKGAPKITAGVLLPDENLLITGHDSGLVMKWNLSNGTRDRLYDCSTEIETIEISNNKEIIIGSHDGDIVVLSFSDPKNVQTLQLPTGGTRSRVWRSLWLKPNEAVVGLTYGSMRIFNRDTLNSWTSKDLMGHTDSIFGMGKSNIHFATGDYYGNILVWSINSGEPENIQKLKIVQGVEDLAWYGDDVLAAVNFTGRIYIFDRDPDRNNVWNLAVEIDNATGQGTCIHISEDGTTIFAGTKEELVQYDMSSEQTDTIDINEIIRIFSKGNRVFVLKSTGLVSFERKQIELRKDLVKYKYLKVSLVGHTGVGKSALCGRLITGVLPDPQSTFGKKIWEWVPEGDQTNGQQKRMLFHDHGGQETVLSTFLPFLSDSDIVLILFQQNDRTTFNVAINILEELRKNASQSTKIYLIQTFLDQKLDELDQTLIANLIDRQHIEGYLKLSSLDGTGIDPLKKVLLSHDMWARARTMIQSADANAVLRTILSLQEDKSTVVQFNEFIKTCQSLTHRHIQRSHLKFILQKFTDQGIIDYYPASGLDLIIVNEPQYNSLKTDVPIYVRKRNGIVSTKELNEAFKNERYLSILDQIYLKYNIAIADFDLRIFPRLLSEDMLKVDETYLSFLRRVPTKQVIYRNQEIEIGRLLSALSELKGQCITAWRNGGLFSWERNAVVYFSFEKLGNDLDGYHIRLSYRVGGKDKEIFDKLESEILKIIQILYGPIL